MTNIIKTFKNKAGNLKSVIILNNDGSFTFRKANKSQYTITREQLISGWWEGSISQEARGFAINYK